MNKMHWKISCGIAALVGVMMWNQNTQAATLTPEQLRCEYLTSPLGIEVETPRLSWTFESGAERGTRQSAYQILVASTEALLSAGKADLWDSGKVESDASIGINYAGRMLRSNELCVWKVRVWDEADAASAWSTPTTWSMGLLTAADWTAQWIGVPDVAAQESASFRDWTRTLPGSADLIPTRVPTGDVVDAWMDAAQIKVAGHLLRKHPEIDGLAFSREHLEELQPASLLRHEFKLKSPVKRATLYLCGLGCYQVRVNGSDLDNRVLDPAETDYDVRAYYTTFDVTDQLRTGNNAIGVMLGDGWYRETIGFASINLPASFGRHALLLQVEIEYADGRTERVVSDKDWKCSIEGPLRKNSVFGGELYDARREMDGWDHPDFETTTNWYDVELIDAPTPRLQSQMIPPLRAVETIQPIAMTNPKPGVWVYDMGTQITGAARLKIDAPEGTAITLNFAESLTRIGEVYQPKSLNMGAKAVDMYISRGVAAEWEPRFTYHSFRYVQMEGFPGKPTLDMLEGRFATQDLEPALEFSCSNDMLNRLHTAFKRTGQQNALHKWTDCPSREKTGWVGYPMHMVMMHNFDAYPFFSKIVGEMRLKTRTMDVNGKSYPGVCRTIIPGRRTAMATSQHGILLPWELYLQYGDLRLLEETYPTMQNTFRYNIGSLTPDGVLTSWIGDWHDALPDFDPKYIRLRGEAARRNGSKSGFGGYGINSDPGPVVSARLCQCAQYMADAARALGKPEAEATAYEDYAVQLKANFIKAYYKPAEKTFGSQTANGYALSLGLCPEGDEQAILESLVEDILVTRNGHFSTGEFGTDRVLEALTLNHQDAAAYTLMTKDDFPSFGLMLAQGATTTWETWGEHILTRNKAGETQLIAAGRPVSHAQFLAADAWFLQSIAGIRRDDSTVGFKAITLRPHMFRQLDWAKASFRTVRGPISSDWKREGDQFIWNIEIPPNTTATVYVPTTKNGQPVSGEKGVTFLREEDGAAVYTIESGSYQFESTVQ